MNAHWQEATTAVWPDVSRIPGPDHERPVWWLGGADQWEELLALYTRLQARDRRPLWACRWGLAGAVVGAVGTLNAGVAQSVTEAGHAGVDFGSLGAGFLLLVLFSVAGYQAALAKRGRHVELCAILWGELLRAARDGLIDSQRFFAEGAVQQGLHQEVETVLRYRASRGTLHPRLTHLSRKIFGLRPIDGWNLL